MSLRPLSCSWPQCFYRVHRAEARETIWESGDWVSSHHCFWAIDAASRETMLKVGGQNYQRGANFPMVIDCAGLDPLLHELQP